MNDNKIYEKLKEFNIPVFSGRASEAEITKLKGYHYFVITKGKLYEKDCHLYRNILVHYIFENAQSISDVEIIDKLKGPGFKFDGMVPDEVRLGDSDRFVEINTFTFIRPERYE